MKNLFFVLAVLLSSSQETKAQCPVVTCPSTLALPCSNTGAGSKITATSNYTNVSSRWINSANIELVSYGTSTSTAFLNYAGTYTVEFKDLTSNCVSTKTVVATNVNSAPPLFGIISSSNFSTGCNVPCPVNVYNGQSQNGGTINYAFGHVGASPVFGTTSTFSAPGCGHYYVMLKDLSNNCISSYFVNIKCTPGPAPAITISPSSSKLCISEASTLTASGASTYTWTNGVTDPTIAVTPTVAGTVYLVGGTDASGCGSSAIIQAVNCSTVNGINSQEANNAAYHIFPNPTADQLTIETEQVQMAKIQYALFDLSGREIIDGTFDQKLELDLSAFSEGSYLLRFSDAVGIWYKKIIIAR
jgi:hypothetical protein